ncbi:DNA ligase D [Bacteriovorax sp. PP10]|uniref:DNA ligase (ATP) n=1 Tax=Bacteriovorax antarcticus TaxID=3088717 RepID=A0ABU5VUK5_9BACT|nr:DNA ligase D [Bacteriovorax sp. PP10]MEA9356719.1 DNA ligase D [Bacteriovorax sp. PP10]
MSLKEYKEKRDFHKTKEPAGKAIKHKGAKMFVVQKHHASHLHYDFRLELDGVLKSWAVPKGPSLNPKDKRLAVEVEDHPIDYATFEGEIPKGEYGGGHVIVWDKGEWIPPKNVDEQLKKGHLEFELHGEKLGGAWLLLRTRIPGAKKNNWLLIKRDDENASAKDITKEDKSVLSGVSMEELEAEMENPRPVKKTAKKSALKIKPQKKTKFLTFKDLKGPELAMLSETPPVGEEWIHEIKYDGYRTLCFKNKKETKLLTRSGLDWSNKYLEIQKECAEIAAESIIFDGEIVWLDEKGRSRFEGLQNSLEAHDSSELVYYVFDLLYLNGFDTRNLPLKDRKKLLREVLEQSDSEKILFSEHWDESGKSVFESACESHLEGIVSKNGESHYHSGRNKNWIKIKCTNIQEFIIGGYTMQENNISLGALLMGAYNKKGKLQYIGKVGTGFDAKTSKSLVSKLKKIKSKESPFDEKSPASKASIWVNPILVGNIEFGAWTGDKILRHAAFKGLREDKKAKEVYLEEVKIKKESVKEITKESKSEEVKLSHPDKIIYPGDKITKQDLSNYYTSINKWILPLVKDRPLALLRCPNGEGKECFFQKHIETDDMGILGKKVESKLKNKKEEIVYIDSQMGLQELVQLGTLEIHSRGCRVDEIDYPNQIVFDFDPDEGVKFEKVKEAAFALKEILERLKLKSFIKVSGGKGLHVHVPIAPKYDWEQIKSFSKSICDQMEREHPEKFTTNMSKSKRKGKIFLDYLRNGYGASAIVPYSVRAREHAPVALPITWAEAKKLKNANSYTLKSVPKLLNNRKDPWAGYNKLSQKIKILDQYKSLSA